MKPTDKEYIEALAEKHWDLEYIMAKDEDTRSYIINDFTAGYQLALEHTNHAELVEAAKSLCNSVLSCGLKNESLLLKAAFLEEKLIKSETSKL